MDNIRLAISDLTIVYKDVSLHVTMTFGLEEYDYNSSPSEMVKHADDKLYYGKTHGRDTVFSDTAQNENRLYQSNELI